MSEAQFMALANSCPKGQFIASHLLRKLLACLFDSYSYSYSHTYHGVVTCADETHHLYVSGHVIRDIPDGVSVF